MQNDSVFIPFHHYCTPTSSTEATAASCPSEGQLSYGHTSRPGPGASSLYVGLAGDESLTCSSVTAPSPVHAAVPAGRDDGRQNPSPS